MVCHSPDRRCQIRLEAESTLGRQREGYTWDVSAHPGCSAEPGGNDTSMGRNSPADAKLFKVAWVCQVTRSTSWGLGKRVLASIPHARPTRAIVWEKTKGQATATIHRRGIDGHGRPVLSIFGLENGWKQNDSEALRYYDIQKDSHDCPGVARQTPSIMIVIRPGFPAGRRCSM